MVKGTIYIKHQTASVTKLQRTRYQHRYKTYAWESWVKAFKSSFALGRMCFSVEEGAGRWGERAILYLPAYTVQASIAMVWNLNRLPALQVSDESCLIRGRSRWHLSEYQAKRSTQTFGDRQRRISVLSHQLSSKLVKYHRPLQVKQRFEKLYRVF